MFKDSKEDYDDVQSDVLRKSRIKPIPYKESKKVYEKMPKQILNTFSVHSSDSVICAYNKDGKDSCDGDSGGPYFMNTGNGNFMIYGIVSYGWGVCGEYSVQYFFKT